MGRKAKEVTVEQELEGILKEVKPKKEKVSVNLKEEGEDLVIAIEAAEEKDGEAPPLEFKTQSHGKNYPVDSIMTHMSQGMLKLPDCQRKFIWSNSVKQAFIRSVLNDIPIIGLTFVFDTDIGHERYILDGFQRLSTLRDFKDGKLTTGPGDTLPNCKFADLPRDMRSKFIYKDVLVNEISAPKIFWPYIFRQINKGGTPLNDHEIRRATPWGQKHQQHSVIIMADEFADIHSVWLELCGKNSRYKGFGALMRALAMHYSYVHYQKPMTAFLDTFCGSLDELGLDADNLRTRLDLIMEALFEEVGKVSFRIAEGKPINLGLLDCMLNAGLLLTQNEHQLPSPKELGKKLKKVRESLLKDQSVRKCLLKDPEKPIDAFTDDTSGKISTMVRMAAVDKYLA